LSADEKRALLTIAPEAGTAVALYADLQNSGTEIQVMRAGIYTGTASTPTTLLSPYSDPVLLAPGMVRAWVPFTGLSASFTAGQFLWLTVQSGTTGGNASYWRDTGVGTMAIAADVFTSGLAFNWGVSTSVTSNSPAFYADYIAAGGATGQSPGVRHVARGSVGWK
jgi:hypothetical protein